MTGGGPVRRLVQLLRPEPLPGAVRGGLAEHERVLARVQPAGGGLLVVTSFGLWVPDGEHDDGGRWRRIGWHLISKATWDGRALTVVEADEAATAGPGVVLADRPERRFVLPAPGQVPKLVQARVTRSVLSSERHQVGDGSALFVQRKVPGQDGVVVQVRPDPGTDQEAVLAATRAVADAAASRSFDL